MIRRAFRNSGLSFSSRLSVIMILWCLLLIPVTWVEALVPRPLYHELSAIFINQSSLFDVDEPYFAYSITYLPSSKRLIVSAPKANNIGEIYSCRIEDNICSKIMRSSLTQRYENQNYTNSYWFGAVVKAGPGHFFTCAPLFTTASKIHDGKAGTFSQCFKYAGVDDTNPQLLRVLSEHERRNTQKHEQQMDSFGWSIDVAGNDVMFGGPAMYTGRATRYNLKADKPESLNPELNPGEVIKYNFGYSVAIGKFFLNDNKPAYAVSSTFGDTGIGKVAIYYQGLRNYKVVHDSKQGVFEENAWVGSMYGAVLCTAKLLQGNQADALLVGAPTFARTHTVNWGAVFVYMPNKFPKSPKYHRTILGKREGSYFGSAIVSVGDLNQDMLDEIAIGAPYEDEGRGAVYIYSGADITSDKTDISYMQRIVDSAHAARSFGHSLTALQDYDDNGCNELAIGAPESNSVVVLRCIATVKIRLFADIPPNLHIKEKVDKKFRDDKRFIFGSCLEVVYPDKPKNVNAELSVTVKIMHPDAKLAKLEDANYVVRIDGTKRICKDITVETPEHGNYDAPINYKINAAQIDPPISRSTFEASRVAISDVSIAELNGHISIAECAIPDNCIVDMEVTSIIFEGLPQSTPYLYTIGTSEKIRMNIVFVNKNEIAYDPCVLIDISNATVLQPPSGCEEYVGADLKCVPETRLRKNETWETKLISLNTADLTNKNEEIRIKISLYEQCEKSKPKLYEEVVQLLTDPSGVKINAITDSGKDDVVRSTRAELEQGKSFQQKYIITNSGPTSWEEVDAKLVVQKRFFITNKNYTVILRILDKGKISQKDCDLISESATEVTYHCLIDKLTRNAVTAEIIIPLFIIPDTLDAAIDDNLNTMYTKLTVTLNEIHYVEHDLNNTFVITKLKWDLWIIIVACLLGLILLIILIVILSKRGFLRRKNREQLEQVQRSVKRQTMQRRSMAHLPKMQDEEILLEDPPTSSNPKKRLRISSADCDAS